MWTTMEKAEKFALTIIFCITLALFIRQSVVCLQRFAKEDTIINLENVRSGKTAFPSLTMCPDYNVAFKSEILKETGISAGQIRAMDFPNGTASSQFYANATWDLHHFLDHMFVLTNDKLEDRYTSFLLPSPLSKDYPPDYKIQSRNAMKLDWNFAWIMTLHKSFGRCYSFTPPKEIKDSGIRQYIIQLTQPSVVFFHHEGQFLRPDSLSKIQLTSTTQKMFVDIMHEVTLDYSKLDGENLTCNTSFDLGFDECFTKMMDDGFLGEYGCTPPFLTRNINDMCNLGEMSYTSEEMKAFKRFFTDLSIKASIECEIPCSTMSLFFGFPSLDNTSEKGPYLKAYFKTRVNVKKKMLAYEVTSFFAEVGGYIGMFLGVSFLDLSKITSGFLRSKTRVFK